MKSFKNNTFKSDIVVKSNGFFLVQNIPMQVLKKFFIEDFIKDMKKGLIAILKPFSYLSNVDFP